MSIRKTKIPWATHVWPVYVGCKRNCKIKTHGFNCYAKRIFDRYRHVYPEMGGKFENVSFIQRNFDMSFPKKPGAIIFTTPSTDPEYWGYENRIKIFKKIEENRQHNFLMLTKNPNVYWLGYEYIPKNLWIGITINHTWQMKIAMMEYRFGYLCPDNIKFVSLEPIREEIPMILFDPDIIDWLIIGGQSGPGEKFYPKMSWYIKLVEHCRVNEIPLFVKPNLLIEDDVNFDNGVIVRPSLIQEYPEVKIENAASRKTF